MGLDGALDSDDLQSFALQIANGMVRSAYENSYAMHDLNELVWSGVSMQGLPLWLSFLTKSSEDLYRYYIPSLFTS